MTPSDIIRAWKDPNYRAGLSATEQAQLPAHPAGARLSTASAMTAVTSRNVPIASATMPCR